MEGTYTRPWPACSSANISPRYGGGSGNSNGGAAGWACGLSDDNLNDLIDGYSKLRPQDTPSHLYPSSNSFLLQQQQQAANPSSPPAYILTAPTGPDFNTTVARILSSNFTVYSDSINTLAGRPLQQPSFPPGRAGFVAASAQTPPIPQLTTTDVFVGGYWNNTEKGNSWWGGNHGTACADLKVSWRWTASGIGSGMYPVNGIIDFVLLPSTEQGQDALVIDVVYAEFNTAAWIMDLGVDCAVPGTGMNSTGQ